LTSTQNVFDQLEHQVPARLLAIELVLVLLLREKPRGRKLLAEALATLDAIEAETLKGLTPEQEERTVIMFEIARASIDKMRTEIEPPRRG